MRALSYESLVTKRAMRENRSVRSVRQKQKLYSCGPKKLNSELQLIIKSQGKLEGNID